MANEVTSANVADAIMQVVAADALPALFGNLVMGNLVNRSFEASLANGGDQVNVPIPPVLTITNIAEGGSVSNQNPSLGNAQITLSTHATCTFTIPDVTKVLASPDLMSVYMQPAIIAVAEDIEASLMNLYPQLTANTAVGSAATITEAVVDNAETALFNAKVPQSEPRFLVVGSSPGSALRQIARFTEAQTLGTVANGVMQTAGIVGGVPASGLFGKVKDFLVYRTQYVAKPSTTYYNLGFARNAIGLVTRRLPMPLPGTGAIAQYVEFGNFGMRVVMSYSKDTLAQQFTVDCLYGVGILRNNFGVQVQST